MPTWLIDQPGTLLVAAVDAVTLGRSDALSCREPLADTRQPPPAGAFTIRE